MHQNILTQDKRTEMKPCTNASYAEQIAFMNGLKNNTRTNGRRKNKHFDK